MLTFGFSKSIRVLLSILFFWLLAPSLCGIAVAATAVTDARLARSTEFAELHITLPQSPKYRIFAMHHPGRIVLDLDNAAVNKALQQLEQIAHSIDSDLARIKVAQFSPTTTRIVLNLKGAVPEYRHEKQRLPTGEHQISIMWRQEKVLPNDSSITPVTTTPADATPAPVSPAAITTPSAPSSPEAQAAENGNTPTVRIERFNVKGNTLLAPEKIDAMLKPFLGPAKTYTDIQRTLEKLEGAYRAAGYSAVSVNTPEQDITEGVVTLEVTESRVGKVIIKGNSFYDESNIRRALPALVEGSTPNARALSANVLLANESPTRQIDLVLAIGETDGEVDAKVNITDESPHKFSMTLENNGNDSTGMYRTGFGYQHNNLFNRDQGVTFNYTTSPNHVSEVTQISASYHLPMYDWGDSVDFIAAYSDVSSGSTPTVAGPLTFSGKGRVFSLRYNHIMPRQGDYTSRVVAGFDYRAYINNCTLGDFGAAGCGSAAANVTVHPLSLSYSGTWSKPAYVADFNATVVHNIPGGKYGNDSDFSATRPSPNGAGGAEADYTVFRFGGNIAGPLFKSGQYHLGGNAQLTHDPLVTGESFGLVGAHSVRGFMERELSNDNGYVFNAELYTPDLAPKINLKDGSLKFLAFIDHARGWNQQLDGESSKNASVASLGIGMRMSYKKTLVAMLDVGNVVDAGGNRQPDDLRGHFNMVLSW